MDKSVDIEITYEFWESLAEIGRLPLRFNRVYENFSGVFIQIERQDIGNVIFTSGFEIHLTRLSVADENEREVIVPSQNSVFYGRKRQTGEPVSGFIQHGKISHYLLPLPRSRSGFILPSFISLAISARCFMDFRVFIFVL